MSRGRANALDRLRVIRWSPASNTDELAARLRRLGYQAPGRSRWTAYHAYQVMLGWESRGWATWDRQQSGMKQLSCIRLTAEGRRRLRDAEVADVSNALTVGVPQ